MMRVAFFIAFETVWASKAKICPMSHQKRCIHQPTCDLLKVRTRTGQRIFYCLPTRGDSFNQIVSSTSFVRYQTRANGLVRSVEYYICQSFFVVIISKWSSVFKTLDNTSRRFRNSCRRATRLVTRPCVISNLWTELQISGRSQAMMRHIT